MSANFSDEFKKLLVSFQECCAVLWDTFANDVIPWIKRTYNLTDEQIKKIDRPFSWAFKGVVLIFFGWPILIMVSALYFGKGVTSVLAFLGLPILFLLPIFVLGNLLRKFVAGTLLGLVGTILNNLFPKLLGTVDDSVAIGAGRLGKSILGAFLEVQLWTTVLALLLMFVPIENNPEYAWIYLPLLEAAFLAPLRKHEVLSRNLWYAVAGLSLFLFLGGSQAVIFGNIKWGWKGVVEFASNPFSSAPSSGISKQQSPAPAQQKEPFQGPNPANQRVIELPSASSGGSRSIPLGSDLEEGPANATLSYGGAGIVQTVRTYNLTILPLPSEKKEEEKITTNTQPPPPSVDDASKWTQWVSHNDRYGYNWDYPGKKSDVLLYVQFKYSTGGYSEVFLDGSGKVMRLEASVTAVRFSNPSSNPPVIVVCKLVDP